MANGTMKKAKADAKKGKAEVGKAANLRADVEADATGSPANGIHTEPGPIFEKKLDTEKESESIELVFGINAGITWESLNLTGPMTVEDLVKATALLPGEIYGALGWLGRENKISVRRQGSERFYSLRP